MDHELLHYSRIVYNPIVYKEELASAMMHYCVVSCREVDLSTSRGLALVQIQNSAAVHLPAKGGTHFCTLKYP